MPAYAASGYVILDEADATAWHVEAALRGVTCCGRVIDLSREDVRREPYGNGEAVDVDHPHSTLCFDCAGRHGTIQRPTGVSA